MRFISIKTKYIGVICCLILTVFCALLIFMRHEFSQRIENELYKRGISITRNIAISAVTPILTENWISLQLFLNETKRNEENIRYIYLVDQEGHLLAHTFGDTFPQELYKTDAQTANSSNTLIQPFYAGDERITDISDRIQQGDFGRVHIGLSEAGIKDELRQMMRHVVPIMAVIMLVGGAGAWWFASKITRPVTRLSAGAKQIGGGNFDIDVRVASNDEIGELANAFNLMLNQLRLITADQKKAEDDLRQQTGILEQEVSEHQVAREDLAVKQHQLESLNRILEERISNAVTDLRLKDKMMLVQGRQAAMGEMINNIAHQWRQPLNNLGLLVQGIQSEYECHTLTAKVLDTAVTKAMNTILFMSQTINDFSNFFSPDRIKTIFGVTQGLKKVTTMLEATMYGKGITLLVEKGKDVKVSGYFNEYNQVLLNLINNAKEILLERNISQPLIRVSIIHEGENAVVRVWDNGGGIPDTIIGQVFDPYFTTKEQGKGSGVGLYMSKMIITEHFGGTLTVENRDGGAEFTVSTLCVPDSE